MLYQLASTELMTAYLFLVNGTEASQCDYLTFALRVGKTSENFNQVMVLVMFSSHGDVDDVGSNNSGGGDDGAADGSDNGGSNDEETVRSGPYLDMLKTFSKQLQQENNIGIVFQ
ncbi:hypothetical protein ANN_08270 [Periplaneta americana]|uniref:Uncharacterized protein n=1 Tax=Periplaneta americana TaxID=6978 RepID=A0ABQ8T2J8_PERAM|nr:hypothetical protein ANN_08270 [Periplaneta americana]